MGWKLAILFQKSFLITLTRNRLLFHCRIQSSLNNCDSASLSICSCIGIISIPQPLTSRGHCANSSCLYCLILTVIIPIPLLKCRIRSALCPYLLSFHESLLVIRFTYAIYLIIFNILFLNNWSFNFLKFIGVRIHQWGLFMGMQ